MDKESVKRYLKDIVAFYDYKLDNDECSLEEMVAIAEAVGKALDVRGTISEFAEFYGQSESNVRNVRHTPCSHTPTNIAKNTIPTVVFSSSTDARR